MLTKLFKKTTALILLVPFLLLPSALYAAIIITEDFTGTNGTDINGFNSWVASSASLDIQSNKAAMTGTGEVYAYRDVGTTTITGTNGSAVFSRYNGTGLRFVNFIVIGASDISTTAQFRATSAQFDYVRSDSTDTSTTLEVRDGTTIIASVTDANFDADGSNVTVTWNINSDGSGSAIFAQGASSNEITWTARTWTNGNGRYSGFNLNHNGTDGTGGTTRSQVDDYLFQTTEATTPPQLIFW